MSNTNRTVTQARDAQIIVGIHKNLQNVPAIPLNAETYTAASLAAFFQSRIDAANAASTARANWISATAAYQALNAKGAAVAHGLKGYVMNTYGKTSPLLADFGFALPKTATQTPEQKAAAVAKRAATRKARNTLGKKAKLRIKGTTAPVVTAPTGSATAIPAGTTAPLVGATNGVTLAPSPAPVAPAPASPKAVAVAS